MILIMKSWFANQTDDLYWVMICNNKILIRMLQNNDVDNKNNDTNGHVIKKKNGK